MKCTLRVATIPAFVTAILLSAHGLPRATDKVQPVPAVVFIPTPHDIVASMLELAAVQQADVVYDLGCGDGRIVVAAAKRYRCRAAGFDIDPRRVEEAREAVTRNGVASLVRIEHQDIFTLDLQPASVITLYLSPKFNAKLMPQLEALKPGSRIVSHQFGIPGVKPDKVVQVRSQEDTRTHAIYSWTTPLKKRE